MTTITALLIFALIPAYVASQKGRSALTWYIYGVVLLPIAAIHAMIIDPLGPEEIEARAKRRKEPGLLFRAKQHLESGEELIAFAKGIGKSKSDPNGPDGSALMIATDRRVIFYCESVKSTNIEDLRYAAITSVSINNRFVFSDITVISSGTQAVLRDVSREEAMAFAPEVRSRIGKKDQAQILTMDVAGQISKLAELRDKGVLSEEEFTGKKKALLDRL